MPISNDLEIILPEIDDNGNITIPMSIDKYETLLKDKHKVELLQDYLLMSKKPTITTIKSIVGILGVD